MSLVVAAVAISALRRFIGGPTNPHNEVSMLGKTCIVTGANTGIGYETAKQLLLQNATGMPCNSTSFLGVLFTQLHMCLQL